MDVDGSQGVGAAVKRMGGLSCLEGEGVLKGGEPGFEGWEIQDLVLSQACRMGDGNAGRGAYAAPSFVTNLRTIHALGVKAATTEMGSRCRYDDT